MLILGCLLLLFEFASSTVLETASNGTDADVYGVNIRITNLGAFDQFDVTVDALVDTYNLYKRGHLPSDWNCSHVLFVRLDTHLDVPYWLEGGCNTTTTSYWLNFDNITSQGFDVLMYFGGKMTKKLRESRWPNDGHFLALSTADSCGNLDGVQAGGVVDTGYDSYYPIGVSETSLVNTEVTTATGTHYHDIAGYFKKTTDGGIREPGSFSGRLFPDRDHRHSLSAKLDDKPSSASVLTSWFSFCRQRAGLNLFDSMAVFFDKPRFDSDPLVSSSSVCSPVGSGDDFADRVVGINSGMAGTVSGGAHSHNVDGTGVSTQETHQSDFPEGKSSIFPGSVARRGHTHAFGGSGWDTSAAGIYPRSVRLTLATVASGYADQIRDPLLRYSSRPVGVGMVMFSESVPPMGWEIVHSDYSVLATTERGSISTYITGIHTHSMTGTLRSTGPNIDYDWTAGYHDHGETNDDSHRHYATIDSVTSAETLVDTVGLFMLRRVVNLEVLSTVSGDSVPLTIPPPPGTKKSPVGAIVGSVFGVLGLFCLIAGGAGVTILVYVSVTRIHKRNQVQASKLLKFAELKDIDLILQEQNAEQDTNMAHIEVNDTLFEVDYDDIEVVGLLGEGGSNTVVYECMVWGAVVDTDFLRSGMDNACFKTSLFTQEKGHFAEFEREVSILASVNHPNILRFFGATLRPPRVGFLTEFCANGSIKDFITKKVEAGESVPIMKKIRWMFEIASAMDHLHTSHIVHRDLKGDNVLLTESEEIRVMDFGLSKVLSKVNRLKTTAVGTSYYMAPEVASGNDYDEKCDVYSFAILMWELVNENFEPYGPNAGRVEFQVATNPDYRPKVISLIFRECLWMTGLISACWDHQPTVRPSFLTILEVLGKYSAIGEDSPSKIVNRRASVRLGQSPLELTRSLSFSEGRDAIEMRSAEERTAWLKAQKRRTIKLFEVIDLDQEERRMQMEGIKDEVSDADEELCRFRRQVAALKQQLSDLGIESPSLVTPRRDRPAPAPPGFKPASPPPPFRARAPPPPTHTRSFRPRAPAPPSPGFRPRAPIAQTRHRPGPPPRRAARTDFVPRSPFRRNSGV